MKNRRAAILILLAVASGLAAFFALRGLRAGDPGGDGMRWLAGEFALTPEQTAAIKKLEADYAPVCAEHCRRINETRARLAALENSGGQASPDYAAARAQWAELARECNAATMRHLESVAAAMSPGQGRRYLALVVPKLAQHEHAQPFGLK
jgi:Spy/CpxP family protein refolding chaperone